MSRPTSWRSWALHFFTILIAYVLWLPPLCFFGVHRVFLGDIPGAILLAGTFGGSLIGGLTDFFRIPSIASRASTPPPPHTFQVHKVSMSESLIAVAAAAFAVFCVSWASDFTGEFGNAALYPAIFTAQSVSEALASIVPLASAVLAAASATVLVFASGHARNIHSIYTLAMGAFAGADIAAILFVFKAVPLSLHWLLSFGAILGAMFIHDLPFGVGVLSRTNNGKSPHPSTGTQSKKCFTSCFRVLFYGFTYLIGVTVVWGLIAIALVSHVSIKLSLNEVNQNNGVFTLPRSVRALTDARIRAAMGTSTEFIRIQAAPLIWSNFGSTPQLIYRAWSSANEEVREKLDTTFNGGGGDGNSGGGGGGNFCIGPLCFQTGGGGSFGGFGGNFGGSSSSGGGWSGWQSALSGPSINDHKRTLGFAVSDEPDAAAIKIAYREKAKISHPDKLGLSASESEKKTAATRFANLDTARTELLIRAERFASGDL